MELIVIHNADAGEGEWSAKRVTYVLRAAGHSVLIASRKKKWRDLLIERPDAFVAAGGDGTVHKLARELAGSDVPLAILPIGTANNVAHAMGYRAGDDIMTRIENWPQNERQLHISVVEADGERQPVVESVGVGAFAQIRCSDGSNGKRERHPAKILLAIRGALVDKLLTANPISVNVQIDGETASGDYLLLECLNLPYYGPRLQLAPLEASEGAALTVCGVRVDQRERAAHWIATGTGDPGEWLLGRGAVIELMSDERPHVDGEVWKHRELQLRAGVQMVRVWA